MVILNVRASWPKVPQSMSHPDIVATLKIILMDGKRIDIWHLILWGKRSSSRSHHLVLWLLGTLTGQQRLYGTRLVT